jgi:hypothetical protein
VKKFWEELIAFFPLKRYRPQRKQYNFAGINRQRGSKGTSYASFILSKYGKKAKDHCVLVSECMTTEAAEAMWRCCISLCVIGSLVINFLLLHNETSGYCGIHIYILGMKFGYHLFSLVRAAVCKCHKLRRNVLHAWSIFMYTVCLNLFNFQVVSAVYLHEKSRSSSLYTPPLSGGITWEGVLINCCAVCCRLKCWVLRLMVDVWQQIIQSQSHITTDSQSASPSWY